MARAAIAAGADGLLIEVHRDPDRALSDGAQSLAPDQFDRLMAELRIIAPAIGRRLSIVLSARRGPGDRQGTGSGHRQGHTRNVVAAAKAGRL